MELHTFHQQYANMPLGERFKVIDTIKYGLLTPQTIYTQIKALEDKIRPDEIRIAELVRAFEEFIISTKE